MPFRESDSYYAREDLRGEKCYVTCEPTFKVGWAGPTAQVCR